MKTALVIVVALVVALVCVTITKASRSVNEATCRRLNAELIKVEGHWVCLRD